MSEAVVEWIMALIIFLPDLKTFTVWNLPKTILWNHVSNAIIGSLFVSERSAFIKS